MHNLKQDNNIFIKEKFYNKERIKNDQELFTSKSNLINIGNDNNNSITFKLNLKELKDLMKKKKNEIKLINNSKELLNKKLYSIFLKKIMYSQKMEQNHFDLDPYGNKKQSKDYIDNDINNNNTNPKKSIILDIEINKKCFNKKS